MKQLIPRRPPAAVLLGLLVVGLGTGLAEAGNLDRYLKKQMRKARVPGMATAIVVDDRLVQAAGYGWADPASEVPVTADTVFLIGSVSKPVTATLAMRLVDQRLLDLDRHVGTYLPFEVRNPNFPDQPITLRQLLNHTSSISDDGTRTRADVLVTEGDWPGSLEQLLVDYLTPGGLYYDASTSFLTAAPGTEFSYSNIGYSLVGALVEAVSGRSFESFTQSELLGPLEMSETSWFLAPLDTANVAVPCRWTGASYEALPYLGMAFYPAGQLRTSARHLANFARLHLNRGEFEGRRLLRRGTVAEMMRVQDPEVAPIRGLGFLLWRNTDGARRAGHSGGFYGASTDLVLLLDEGWALVVLTNGEPYFRETFPDEPDRELRAMARIQNRLFREAKRLARRQ